MKLKKCTVKEKFYGFPKRYTRRNVSTHSEKANLPTRLLYFYHEV